MIADKNRAALEVSGNLTGESFRAGIDDEDMAHIISLFTDLYSDTILAVVREYTTNGRDAQIEAGRPNEPVQITLPSTLAPYFKVRDTGTGLDADDIERIYSRYGRSTKRGTNDATGMLGLGCKSALTYTEQFVVTSVKDGHKLICTVSREGTGVPVMTAIDGGKTSEPNGTEVSVPIRQGDQSAFERRAYDLFKFWPEGSLLINGKAPERFDGLKLTDTLWVTEDESNDIVVMGGVAYPVEYGRIKSPLAADYNLVAFVPMGDVNFPPNREMLTYDGGAGKTTMETLKRIGTEAQQALQGAIQREVDAAKSPAEALATVEKWRGMTNTTVTLTYTYQGREVPSNFSLGSTTHPRYGWAEDRQFEVVGGNYYGRGQSHKASRIKAADWHTCAWIMGYSIQKFTAQHKRKLDKYRETNPLPEGITKFILVQDEWKDKVPTDWIDSATIIQWEDVAAIKLPAVQNPGSKLNGRIPGSYDCFVNGDYVKGVEANDIDQKKPVYWLSGTRSNGAYYAPVLKSTVGEFTMVMMPANRVEKFKRNFPAATPVVDGVRAAHDAWFKALSDDAKLALSIHDAGAATELTMIDASLVDDPDVAMAAKDADFADLQRVLEQRRMFNTVLGSVSSTNVEWENPLRKYPLFSSRVLSYYPEHTYQYLNLAYEAMTKGV